MRLLDKIKAFHKNEDGAQVSTEVIILLAVGAGIAVALGIFAKIRLGDMKGKVDSQLQGFENFESDSSGDISGGE